MNKSFIIITLIFLLTVSLGCAKEERELETKKMEVTQSELNWLVDYDQAIEQATKEDKMIIVNFTGSDWCSWCKRLKAEVFSHQEFINYAEENYVMLMIDFPSTFQELPQEEQEERINLQKKYGVRGYPTILIVNSQGQVIGQTGYQAGGPKKYIQHLEDIQAKTY